MFNRMLTSLALVLLWLSPGLAGADEGSAGVTLGDATRMTVGDRTITVRPIFIHGIAVDGAREVTISTRKMQTTRRLGALPTLPLVAPSTQLPRECWKTVELALSRLGHLPDSWEAAPGWPRERWVEIDGRLRHALVHAVHLTETNEQVELWIAPETEELLTQRDLDRHGGEFEGEVVGRIPANLLPYSATVPTTIVPLVDLRVLPTGSGPVFTDGAGQFTVVSGGTSVLATAELTGAFVEVQNQGGPGTQVFAPLSLGTVSTLEFGDPTSEFISAEVSAYAIPSAARRWLLEASPGLAAASAPVLVHVNIAGTCYSAYLPLFQVIQLTRAGGGCANASYGTLLAHEFFHHIQNQLPGTAELEVEEANADIFAAFFLDDPRIGLHYMGPSSSLRDLSLDVLYPVPSSVPQDSGLPLAAGFWDFRSELIASLGPEVGAQAAVELWLTWVFAGSGILDPGTLEELLILDDDDGDLSNGTPHGTELIAAFPPHGLSLPLEPVTGLSCQAIEERVELAWTLPTLGTQTSIEIHRDGVVLANLSATATSYIDPLPPAGFHEWFVVTRQGPGAELSAACPQTLTTVLPFIRGDVTGNGILDLGDAINLLTYMFSGSPMLTCLDAADFDDDGTNDLADALNLLGYLFGDGAPPVAPFPESDYDPTPDSLLCN